MDLRPGHIMTDPQLQGGTTMTPESMKGDALLCHQDYLFVPDMKDIHCITAAITAAVEGAEAPCHPQGGATEGIIFIYPSFHMPARLVLPKFCNLGFQEKKEKKFKTTRNQSCDFVSQGSQERWKEDRNPENMLSLQEIPQKSEHVDRMHPNNG